MRTVEPKGFVSLVGAGPGDPELLTQKGLRLLAAADVILYDRLVSAEILALGNAEAEFIYCGKDEGHQEAMQLEIFQLMLERATRGLRVVRLKGGDPILFGRGAEEVEFLQQAGVGVEVVPGVSSAFSVPAMAGIPVTLRGVARSVAVVSGRCKGRDEADWSKVARVDTLVVLMGVKHRVKIATALIACGRDAGQAVAFARSEKELVVSTLFEVAAGKVEVEAPAVWVMGEVVRHRWTLEQVLDEVAV